MSITYPLQSLPYTPATCFLDHLQNAKHKNPKWKKKAIDILEDRYERDLSLKEIKEVETAFETTLQKIFNSEEINLEEENSEAFFAAADLADKIGLQVLRAKTNKAAAIYHLDGKINLHKFHQISKYYPSKNRRKIAFKKVINQKQNILDPSNIQISSYLDVEETMHARTFPKSEFYKWAYFASIFEAIATTLKSQENIKEDSFRFPPFTAEYAKGIRQKGFFDETVIRTSDVADITLFKKENGACFVVKEKKKRLEEFEAGKHARLQNANLLSFGVRMPKNGAFPNESFCMEHAKEGDLDSYLQHESLNAKELCSLLLDYASGLEYMEASCVVHLDIKPKNLFVELKEGKLKGKIGDFEFITKTKEYGDCGTAGYRSPETYKRSPVSSKSDVWSFGIVLLKVLYPQVSLYHYSDEEGILSLLNQSEFELYLNQRLESKQTQVVGMQMHDKEVKALIKKCLYINPESRISASALKQELRELLDSLSL